MDNRLNEYLDVIDSKNFKKIKELNVKYSQQNLNNIVIEIYDYNKLDPDKLKKVISMSFENHVQFNITEDFLIEIIIHYDIYSLKIILKHYLYNNDFIKCLLYKYKYNHHLFNSEFKEYIDYEKSKLFSNELLPLSILCKKYCERDSDQSFDLINVKNIVKILIENGTDVNKKMKMVKHCYSIYVIHIVRVIQICFLI